MNKKILFGLLVIGLISALAGAGMYAYFNDTETSTGNVFQAGTLDLKLWDGSGWGDDVSGLITLDNMEPGAESGYITVKVKNEGSLPGVLSYTIDYTKIGGDTPTADEVAAKIYVTVAGFDRNCDGTYEPRTAGSGTYGWYSSTYGWSMTQEDASQIEILESTWWTEFSDTDRADILTTGKWEGAPHPTGFDEWVLPDWLRWADTPRDGYLSIYEIGLKTWSVDDMAGTPELDPGEVYMWQLKFMLDPDVPNAFQAQGVDVTITFELNQQ